MDTIRWQYDTKLLFPLNVSFRHRLHVYPRCSDSKFLTFFLRSKLEILIQENVTVLREKEKREIRKEQ